ncbi:MAG TPA: hypothetical protein VFC71_10805 [Candidatus Polarisedimenticolia bacterium]|nr:hypothetical protein [Candidatus Polarisedimenticolia bacterium]
MDESPATPQPKRPRRAETVSEMPDRPASAKARRDSAAAAAAEAAAEVEALAAVQPKAGFVVLEGESMPNAQLASLELHQGAIGRVEATDVSINQGALGGARADRVTVSQGALGGALAGEVRVSQGAVGTVIAREAHIENAVIGRVFAQDVRIQRPSAVIFLLAQRVTGEVRVLFDWKSALALGGAIGLVSGLVRRIARRRD